MGLARRIGRAAKITLIACAVGTAVLLAAEAALARTRRYARADPRLSGRSALGDPRAHVTRLVMLGDSTALGVGAEQPSDTVGGVLAASLATEGRRVELTSVAVIGSRTRDLATQVARAIIGPQPDVAVILVGGNDATRLRRPSEVAGDLADAVARLRDADVSVVVGTCPDLGAVRSIAPPLRQLVAAHGRRVARAQMHAVRLAGGVPVDLGAATGPVFRADAGTFCYDGFHPSADGYRIWAHALLPAVRDAATERDPF